MTSGRSTFLVVGEGIWPWYMAAASEALRKLDYEVAEFHWATTFKKKRAGQIEPEHRSTWHRLEERAGFGPIVAGLNRNLVRKAMEVQPNFVFFYNVRLVYPRTMRRLRTLLPDAVFGQYANDNPFSERASVGYWNNFLRSVPWFDLHFAYRLDNLDDFRRRGAQDVRLIRSYYRPEVDRPVPTDRILPEDRSEVLFAGHYEPDGRLEALTTLVDGGVALRLHGGGWTSVLESLPAGHPLRRLMPATPIVGADYRRAIAGAEVALCFLSTMNKDTYTRRNFEIPAIGTAVLSQYSDDLASLFAEGSEIAFFRSSVDLLAQARTLLNDPNLRANIARGGRRRVVADGHDVLNRMTAVAEAFESARSR